MSKSTNDTNSDDSDADEDDEYDGNSYCEEFMYDDDASQPCDRSSKEIASVTLSDEELLICRATLKAYSLKNKKWRKLIYCSTYAGHILMKDSHASDRFRQGYSVE